MALMPLVSSLPTCPGDTLLPQQSMNYFDASFGDNRDSTGVCGDIFSHFCQLLGSCIPIHCLVAHTVFLREVSGISAP